MGSRILFWKEQLDNVLNDDKQPWSPFFEWVEKKTGVQRVYVFVACLVFTGFYLVFGYGAQLYCNIIGFVYPAYRSIKALETPQKDDDTKWLTYWVVFAAFSIVEFFSGLLLHWFPFYWLIKCLFFIWCFVPLETNGSLVIYRNIIRPYFLKHQADVDNAMNKIADSEPSPAVPSAAAASPTEDSPTEASPAEDSPAETSPIETSPEETSPEDTGPGDTFAGEISSTEISNTEPSSILPQEKRSSLSSPGSKASSGGAVVCSE